MTPSIGFHGRTLILDLGDVLFHQGVHTLTALSSTFPAVVWTPAGELERGKIRENEASEIIGAEISLEPQDPGISIPEIDPLRRC
jgi:hypothetical protein